MKSDKIIKIFVTYRRYLKKQTYKNAANNELPNLVISMH